jgi:hemolysin D
MGNDLQTLLASILQLVTLDTQKLVSPSGEAMKLSPGMQLSAEVHQGRRSVLEYLISPVQKVRQEAGREP